ncbi:hypothetical protein DDU33_07825 [Actinobacillus porcitonsillarum]|uniref:Phosphoribosyl-ATP pyrophosphohydrolase n=1 Tax=Actinobacillus porcitonsillarum TaxID=189834 RepID=A0A2U8FK85_9PAST|nr:nucleoside triphosphate pyrophosphohydrolase family protein [Actinobacillus porcitonsillarum]AWI51399.1 hypothetical protein DDU33_07825 [Actinobacillus porcitonsillarum]
MNENTINLNQIENWFKTAVPSPTIDSQRVQISCHFEEVAEMLECLGLFEGLFCAGHKLFELSAHLRKFDNNNKFIEHLSEKEKIELLDALCDQIVTAIGVAHMFGFNIQGALKEVADSNDSKFEDGKPVFNDYGKIEKGKHYFKPNLERFV